MSELMITRRPNRKPTHPGEVLREDVLPAMRESVIGFAKRAGMSRQSIHAILSGRRGISPEAALRIGAVVGNGARVWLAMQMEYDLWKTEQALHDELASIAA
ncbi:MAG: HigA family addiction module antitoxin [Mariprofundaceae bacterium]|nr:HigA family addiction module antitoxin [Mariprofundaceae bacterium]